ncbi:MAG: hypothetical protein H6806_01420 [Planctomycetes bacterium]|nr:hypothetical protein [Planctomycetota bacterium]
MLRSASRARPSTWRHISRVLLLVLLVPVAWTQDTRPTLGAEPATLTTLSDAVDTRAFRWAAPAVGKLDAELTAVAEAAHASDASISLATWAAYGSGFLRYVQRGRDLDCMAVFDLGAVPAAGAAERALARVETIVRAFVARTLQDRQDPGLVPWKVEGADAEGRIENREQGLALLDRALTSRSDRALSVVMPRADGSGLATVMMPGEVPLPAMADAAYLSNAVRYREGMPAAIRQISVMLYFTIEVEHPDGARRRWMLTPSLTWLGLPIPFEPLAFFLAFPHAQARDRYAHLIDPARDLLQTRLWLAADLMRTGRAMYDKGSATKTLKRMHQALELVGPALAGPTRTSLEQHLSAWLAAPPARELSDLEKVATIMKEVARIPALHQLYVGSGTVKDIASHWTSACDEMVPLYPGHRAELQAVAAELARLAAAGDTPEPEAWETLSRQAGALATDTGPTEAEVDRDLAQLEALLVNAGWRFVPVVGADGDRISVSRSDLAQSRIYAPALEARRYGDFGFDLGEGEATFRLPLRLKHEPAEQQALACLRCRLGPADAAFRSRLQRARAR